MTASPAPIRAAFAETSIQSLTITANGVTVDGVEVTGEFSRPDPAASTSGVYVAAATISRWSIRCSTARITAYGASSPSSVTGLDVGDNLITGYGAGIYVSGGGTTGSIHDNLFQGDGPGSGTGHAERHPQRNRR